MMCMWTIRVKFYHCGEIDSPNVLIVGDVNACPKHNFGEVLSQFCLEHELKISDKIVLPADSFTYVTDTHGKCSWLDHLHSSKSAHGSIQNTELLHQFILSDHRPVAVIIKTTVLPQTYFVITRHNMRNIWTGTKPHSNKNWNINRLARSGSQKYPYLKNVPHVTILCAKTNSTFTC